MFSINKSILKEEHEKKHAMHIFTSYLNKYQERKKYIYIIT